MFRPTSSTYFMLLVFYLSSCHSTTTKAKDDATSADAHIKDSIYFNAVLPAQIVIDSIVVEKKSHILMVFNQGVLLKKYRVALGTQPVGHKQFEGDRKTPEGLYYINGKNPNSSYYKNLGISYPNANDLAYAKTYGKSAGGDVKIHGLPPSWADLGKTQCENDWTWGCIALSNEEMEELYTHVKIGSPIFIYYQK